MTSRVSATEPDGRPARPAPSAGGRIVLLDVAGTVAFAVTAVLEVVLFRHWTEVVGVTVALVLFALGCAAFLVGYARAVQRSRTDEISVAGLFLLMGPAVPGAVKLRLGLLLAVQVVVGARHRRVRTFTPLAFGMLVPVFGLGLNGLWAARHGRFPPRRVAPTAPGSPQRGRDGAECRPWLSPPPRRSPSRPRPSSASRWPRTSPATPSGPRTSRRPWSRRRDDQGRATAVEFRASALGRSTHYTLGLRLLGRPEKLSWQLVHGDIMRAIDGAYTFAPSATDPGSTDVVYDLSIELVVPLPGFVKRRAEVRILNTVKELKARAES